MINDMKAPRVVETITRFEMMEVATFVLKGNNQKKKSGRRYINNIMDHPGMEHIS